MAHCWSCQAETPETGVEAHFCACGKIQPYPHASDLFAFLGLERQFHMPADAREALEARYHELSRRLHPDRFTRATARERRLSMAKTTDLNQAVRILRDPVKRAHHLLASAGRELKEERRADPAFLMEVMETRERIAELKAAGAPARAEMDALAAELLAEDAALMARLDASFAHFDRRPGGPELDQLLDEIAGIVDRHKYHEGILRELTS